MLTTDQVVLAAVAHGHAHTLDQSGFQPEWITDLSIRHVVSAAISLSRAGRETNLLNVMATARSQVSDWSPITKIWQNGYGDVDPKIAYSGAKHRYLAEQVKPIAQEIERLAAEAPEKIESWLATQTGRLVSVVRQSTDYDPRPSAHYAKDTPGVMFKSKIPTLNAILRGGYRNGLLFFLVTPTAHGKTTMAITLTCDALSQGKKVCYINNENTERKALDRILRGLSQLTEEEISKRQGNDDERNETLKLWLAYIEENLRIYNHAWYNDDRIKRILKWESPDLLIGDYLKDQPGMFTDGKRHDDTVGDFADFLLNAVNEYGVTAYFGAQVAGDAGKKYMRHGSDEIIHVYGTAKVGMAADLYGGMRRDPYQRDSAEVTIWKDRIGNRQDTKHHLGFDPLTWVFRDAPQPAP